MLPTPASANLPTSGTASESGPQREQAPGAARAHFVPQACEEWMAAFASAGIRRSFASNWAGKSATDTPVVKKADWRASGYVNNGEANLHDRRNAANSTSEGRSQGTARLPRGRGRPAQPFGRQGVHASRATGANATIPTSQAGKSSFAGFGPQFGGERQGPSVSFGWVVSPRGERRLSEKVRPPDD